MQKLAFENGPSAICTPFPLWPQYTSLEKTLLVKTLETGNWWRHEGGQVSEFEKSFSNYHHAQYAIAVTNGTHALELALRSADIGPGDEVIIPSLTFIATAMAVFNVGAIPIPVDVDLKTWCIDPVKVQERINARTKAIIPVHFAGHISAMEKLRIIADEYEIFIIEDAAHAHGAKREDRMAGSFGIMAAFSFQNFKLLSAGEGGMLLFNDESLFRKAELMSNCGRKYGEWGYNHISSGSNFRLSEFQAAVLNAQLTRLDQQGIKREQNANYLREIMNGIDGLLPQERENLVDRHAYYMFVAQYDETKFYNMPRELFVKLLQMEGVPVNIMYPPVQHTPFFKGQFIINNANQIADFDCPVSESLGKKGVWFHHRILLGEKDSLDQLAAAIEKIRFYSSRYSTSQMDRAYA